MNAAVELTDRWSTRLRRPYRADRQRPPPHLQGIVRLDQPHRPCADEDYGLKPGHRVLIRSANNPAMVACWLAATKAGAVVVNTMPMLRAGELAKIIDKAEIPMALCDTRLIEELMLRQGQRLPQTTIARWSTVFWAAWRKAAERRYWMKYRTLIWSSEPRKLHRVADYVEQAIEQKWAARQDDVRFSIVGRRGGSRFPKHHQGPCSRRTAGDGVRICYAGVQYALHVLHCPLHAAVTNVADLPTKLSPRSKPSSTKGSRR